MEPNGKPDASKQEEPLELYCPIEWSHQELDGLRVRVKELMVGGLRRSEASQVAFNELVCKRKLEQAQRVAEHLVPIGTKPPDAA
jgi:hypothetical protein